VKPFRGPREEEPHWKVGFHGGASLAQGRSGGASEVGPRPRRSVDGGGGVDAASSVSCVEAEGGKNGGGKRNWGPGELLMGEPGGGGPGSGSGGLAGGRRAGAVETASGQ
jgi:hypothetical protein